MSENFENINAGDGKLTKSEIKEIKEISSYEREKLEVILKTNVELKNLIDTDYRWANENYLAPRSVKSMQEHLNKSLGLDLIPDGDFGKNTFLALIRFQKENGLTSDGICGPKTQAKLFSSDNNLSQYSHTKSNVFQFNESRYNVNDKIDYLGITSVGVLRNPRTRKTLCSRTARLDAQNLGIHIHQGISAFDSMRMYDNNELFSRFTPPKGAKFADVFLEGASWRTRSEGHRAVAFNEGGSWLVLDPYTRINGRLSKNPIPLEDYLGKRKLEAVAFYSDEKYVISQNQSSDIGRMAA